MNIESVRADERLIHGQLINEWLHVLKPTRLLVCDDALMQMPFMANMYRSLVPIWLEARILSLEQTVEYLRLHADTEGRSFLLFYHTFGCCRFDRLTTVSRSILRFLCHLTASSSGTAA